MLFLKAAALRGFDARALDELLARPGLVVAFGEGELRGHGAAALLLADYAVLRRGATLTIDVPEGWAGVVWRLGRKALSWNGNEAELVDELTNEEPQTWLASWQQGRSVLALDTAATLIRSRGGDRLESAEFARLFAIGEPQKGLGAFLAKKSPRYS
jgi:hypothetical protein